MFITCLVNTIWYIDGHHHVHTGAAGVLLKKILNYWLYRFRAMRLITLTKIKK